MAPLDKASDPVVVPKVTTARRGRAREPRIAMDPFSTLTMDPASIRALAKDSVELINEVCKKSGHL